MPLAMPCSKLSSDMYLDAGQFALLPVLLLLKLRLQNEGMSVASQSFQLSFAAKLCDVGGINIVRLQP